MCQLGLVCSYLATDEGLSIFCCELVFVCDRCDLLLDLTTLFERPFEEEKLNMVTEDRGVLDSYRRPKRAQLIKESDRREGPGICVNERISWRLLHGRLTLQHARCMSVLRDLWQSFPRLSSDREGNTSVAFRTD